jgi:hypothetical protein
MRDIDDDPQANATYLTDGRVFQMDKRVGALRFSLNSWPDFESAKSAYHQGRVKWGEWDC